jgi:hypothetical protein
MAVYRAQVSVDGLEIEIEAPSLSELKKAIADAGGKAVAPRASRTDATTKGTSGRQSAQAKPRAAGAARSPIEIVNAIKNDERWSDIETKVLDNRSELPRILMVGFFAQQTEQPEVTTADIQSVTDELAVRIRVSNAANSLKTGAGRFFASDRVRKRGQQVRYRLNRAGEREFLRILDAE